MQRSESEERNRSSKDNSPVKSCSDCHTTRTPLWRGGPAGPKSLCNACGIKYNKKRRQMLGLERGRNEKGKKRRKSGGGEVAEDAVDGIGRRDGVAEIGKAVESVARGGTGGDTFDGSLLRLRLRLDPARFANPSKPNPHPHTTIFPAPRTRLGSKNL
nr:GATA transcription factor 16-like [Ipomoea batatas]